MIWENWHDFFAMGGYALYVWGSFLVVFACLGGEMLLLAQRRAAIGLELARARELAGSSKGRAQ
jgi:heme exporter protein D